MEAITRNTNADLVAARRRLAVIVEIARYVWIVNAAVTGIGAYFGRYDIAALAGFTWVLTLIATVIGKKAHASLREEPGIRPAGATER